jgi:hypothetical protein
VYMQTRQSSTHQLTTPRGQSQDNLRGRESPSDEGNSTRIALGPQLPLGASHPA